MRYMKIGIYCIGYIIYYGWYIRVIWEFFLFGGGGGKEERIPRFTQKCPLPGWAEGGEVPLSISQIYR